MTTIVTRAGKGSPLTHTEVDANFTNLNTAKLEAGAIAFAVNTTKAQDEESQIKLSAAFSVGTAGAIPFGIGPVIPPGMAFAGIGPDAYNPIHLASGSFC